MIKKTFYLLLIILFTFNCYSQNKDLKVRLSFFFNNHTIEDYKCYIINKKEKKAYLLKKENDSVVIKDTVTSKGIPLLIKMKNNIVVFPFYYYKSSKYINVYYDNRLFNNQTKKHFRIGVFKNIFKKKYYIQIEGLDDIITVFNSKTTYELIGD